MSVTRPGFEADEERSEFLLREAVGAGMAGDHALASRLISASLALVPDRGELWANLAIAARSVGEAVRPEVYTRRALTLRADRHEIWALLADILTPSDPEGARKAYRTALALEPLHAPTWTNLALLLRQQSHRSGTLAYSRRALTIDTANVENWNNFGLALADLGRLGEARAAFEVGISIDGRLASPHANLANILVNSAHVEEGLASYRRAIALDPHHAEGLNGLAGGLKDQSLTELATMIARSAMACDPVSITAAKTYLACLLHLPGLTPARLYDEHRRVVSSFETEVQPLPASPNTRDKARRLVVGYVSSDLRGHPVARYLKAAFEYRNAEQIRVIVYSDVRAEDAETAWYRSKADLWRNVQGLHDAAVGKLVRTDGVDILVVPAAHFDDNRLLLAAYGAAPIQVSAFAGTTTGVLRSTHWLTDAVLHPEGIAERFTETLQRLPVLHFFRPPAGDPPIVEPPMRTKGFVTFGCFVSPARINPVVIRSWSRILARLPTAKLVLKNRTAFRNREIQSRYRRLFESSGGDFDRVQLMTSDDSRYDHQKRYNDLDIVLDTFPFTGASASFDALWMGVPVITLSGWGFVQRMTESLHVPLGLKDLVARTTDEYEELAVSVARDPVRLLALRQDLRQRIEGSILCDGPAYARSLEAAYRAIWERWCETGPSR